VFFLSLTSSWRRPLKHLIIIIIIMNPKATWGIVASIGAIIFVLGVGLGFGLFPFLISHQVNSNLDLWDMESEGRKNFVIWIFCTML
jgi:cytochrome bd-type quinol oxidase subunit 2